MVCSELFQALGRIREDGVGILLVEQNAKRSLAIADRGYLIETGRIVGRAPPRRCAPTLPSAAPISAPLHLPPFQTPATDGSYILDIALSIDDRHLHTLRRSRLPMTIRYAIVNLVPHQRPQP